MQNISSIRTIAGYSSAIFLLSLFTFISAHSATFRVTKVADTNDGVCDADCSLREAINAANNAAGDDSINFEDPFFNSPRTISLSGSRLIISNNGALTINGPAPNLLTISGNGSQMIFSVETADANATINNLTLANGYSDGNGGAIYSRGTLTAFNIIVTNSRGFPGAIANNGTMTITHSTIFNNIGTAILNENGTLSMTSVTVSQNTSIGISNIRGDLTVTNSSVNNNTATIGGAGIRNQDGTATLNRVQINNNSTTGFGNDGAGVASITADFSTPASMTIRNSTIDNNVVNGESSDGGGVAALGGNAITIINTTISNNRSLNDGGGIYARSPVTLINSVVCNNTATGNGGGIISASIINSTNSTICNNRANRGGGIYRDPISGDIALVTLKNSILADNQSTNTANPAPDYFGSLNSQGYNLIENTANTTITGTTTGNIIGQDPQLLPLGNYGGATQSVGLLATSPAIDAADPNDFPTTDQRGIPRPSDGDLNGSALPDIGAYERQLNIFTVTKTADTNDETCNSDCSLREAIFRTNIATTADNAIVFDASLFSSPQTITLTGGQLLVQDNKSLFIKGPGADLLSISGNQLSRVFFFNLNSKSAIEGLTITNGRETQGAGIWFNTGANLSINKCVISGNTTTEFEGAGIHNNSGTLVINNSKIINNSSVSRGGGLYGLGTTVINNSIFDGNSSTRDGGGIYVNGGFLVVNNSQITNNRALTAGPSNNSSGGGIYFNGQTLTVNNSAINNNGAAGNTGGGLYNNSSAFLYNTTVSRNSALGGGGIWNGFFANITITSSTISNNSSTSGAGGINFGGGDGVNNLINSTIASNSTIGDGGGIINLNSVVNLKNSIIADNTATVSSPDFEGTVNSQGFNLIENTIGTNISGTTTGNILGVDPQLLPLKNYGGATQTHALRATSPAIDKGNNSGIITDQRGRIRPYDNPQISNGSGNGTDIGAFERQNAEIIPGIMFDFDGDSKTDIGIFRPATGAWWINASSTNVTTAIGFGASDDKLIPADYTGDGKADIAYFRPSTGQWFVLRSENYSFYGFQFGAAGDIPAPGDFDGDGKADAAVFRPSTASWYILRSSDGAVTSFQFGVSEDKPVIADYDGDGKDDIGVFRPTPAEWWILKSSGGVFSVQFGQTGDKAVPGDYTGDGKADVAFWRPSTGTWYVIRSEDFSFYGFPFGDSTDVPTPGDYDGDGKTDAAVFRPSNSSWYLLRSTAGFIGIAFGANGDQPIPNVYIR